MLDARSSIFLGLRVIVLAKYRQKQFEFADVC